MVELDQFYIKMLKRYSLSTSNFEPQIDTDNQKIKTKNGILGTIAKSGTLRLVRDKVNDGMAEEHFRSLSNEIHSLIKSTFYISYLFKTKCWEFKFDFAFVKF